MAFKLLLVEDDAELRDIIADFFSVNSQGTYLIEFAATGCEGQQ